MATHKARCCCSATAPAGASSCTRLEWSRQYFTRTPWLASGQRFAVPRHIWQVSHWRTEVGTLRNSPLPEEASACGTPPVMRRLATWPRSCRPRNIAAALTRFSILPTLLAETSCRLQSQKSRAKYCRGQRGSPQARRSRKKQLSALLDAAALEQLKNSQAHDASFRAHIELCGLPSAGAWLTSLPVADGREIDSPVLRVELQRRLRVPLRSSDTFCPCCGEVLDRFGDHAATCACHGDRTVRHNAVRNVFFSAARDANLSPEREKAGLLPQRPDSDDLPRRPGRRPADVWLPRGQGGEPEACDFAITSAMRTDMFRQVPSNPAGCFPAYEKIKAEFKDTAASCTAAGFRFVPLVMEAHAGAWSSAARRILDWISHQTAASTGESPASVSLRTAQRISSTLHRESARAVLTRLGEPMAGNEGLGHSAWEQQADA